MMGSRGRIVNFHRLHALVDAQKRYVDAVDWVSVMSDLKDATVDQLTVDGLIFQPDVINGVAVLGMHRPISTDFLSKFDPKTKKVMDVIAEQEQVDINQFANSTAVGFSKNGNAFGLALGDTHSSRAQSVTKFAEAHQGLGKGSHWRSEPLMDEGRLKQYLDSNGVAAFSTRFTTAKDLIDHADGSVETSGVIGYAESMAETVEADLEIEISVKLTGTGSAAQRSKLKNFLTRDLPILARNKSSRTHARAEVGAGVFEDLNLVSASLSQQIDLEETQTKSGLFSDLLTGVSVAVAEMDTRIQSLI